MDVESMGDENEDRMGIEKTFSGDSLEMRLGSDDLMISDVFFLFFLREFLHCFSMVFPCLPGCSRRNCLTWLRLRDSATSFHKPSLMVAVPRLVVQKARAVGGV